MIFAKEDRLLLDLTGARVHEPRGHEQRPVIRQVVDPALGLGVLRRVEHRIGQLELELTGEVLDRRDVAQYIGDPLLEEPREGLALHRDQVGQLQDLTKLSEREPFPGRETHQRHSSGCETGCETTCGRAQARTTGIKSGTSGTTRLSGC